LQNWKNVKKGLLFLLICCLFSESVIAVNTKNVLIYGIVGLTIGMTLFNLKTRMKYVEEQRGCHNKQNKEFFARVGAYCAMSKYLERCLEQCDEAGNGENFKEFLYTTFSGIENVKNNYNHCDDLLDTYYDLNNKYTMPLTEHKDVKKLSFIIFLQNLNQIAKDKIIESNQQISYIGSVSKEQFEEIRKLDIWCTLGTGMILGGFLMRNLK